MKWIWTNWKPFIEHCPMLSMLVNGWFCFHFLLIEASDRILAKAWMVIQGSLVLRWNNAFNPLKEPVTLYNLWCLLLGFLLQLRSQSVIDLWPTILGDSFIWILTCYMGLISILWLSLLSSMCLGVFYMRCLSIGEAPPLFRNMITKAFIFGIVFYARLDT